MANKIRIKMGPIEFEAEGDSELIERERAQFFTLLPQAMLSVSPVVSQPNRIVGLQNYEKDTLYEIESSNESNIIEDTSVNSKYESVAGFLNQKSFIKDIDIVMGVAYYIEIVEKINTFTSKDIENRLSEARRPKPSNTSHHINQNIKKGFIKECSEKRDGLKTFSVLADGIRWAELYTAPDKVEIKKKATITKPNNESPLLSISVDELNINKYCDISKINKFNEQMLVMMLMYTQEKHIEYFSFNDIVCIFKNKFRIPTTERKVRYAFDTGGIMFDKKTDKKIVLHKLMSKGIQEAERIVNEQRTMVI